MPFRLGGKRFRHETEYDYLCHLQAVVSSSTRLGRRKHPYVVTFQSWRVCCSFAVLSLSKKVEILVKYNQLDYVLVQLDETTKKPRANTSPLVAVPLRLDLTPEQVDRILGWHRTINLDVIPNKVVISTIQCLPPYNTWTTYSRRKPIPLSLEIGITGFNSVSNQCSLR